MNELSLEILARKWVGFGPFGILAAPGRLYVSVAHGNGLVVLDRANLEELIRAPTGRQPRGLTLKGYRLYVGHLPDASVGVFDVRTLGPLGANQIRPQSAFAETITIHADRHRAYIPHQQGKAV